MTSSTVAATWRTVDEQVPVPGEKQVSVSLPWEALEPAHVLHVRRLRELAAETDADGLTSYADRWEGYICDWRHLPIDQSLHVPTSEGITPVSDVPGCDGSGSAVPPAEQLEEQGG